jgi:hypothetical protein
MWIIVVDVPDEDLKYSYVVVDDFDPNKTIYWEPRTDRILKKGATPIVDDWGVKFRCCFGIFFLGW